MNGVRRDNFFTIQGFMLTDLKLKGNELLIYAIIYGFSQTEGQQFTGSLKYLAGWTNSTTRNVISVLQKLEKKNLIIKTEEFIDGVKFCKYAANIEFFSGDMKNFQGGSEKNSRGVVKKFQGGSEKSSHNNINNTINNTIDNNIEDSGSGTPVCFSKIKKENCNSLIDKIENDDLRKAYFEYAKMRKSIKKPLTEYSLKLLQNKVNKLSKDVSMQVNLLNKATLHNWLSVYENYSKPGKPQLQYERDFNEAMQGKSINAIYAVKVKSFLATQKDG